MTRKTRPPPLTTQDLQAIQDRLDSGGDKLTHQEGVALYHEVLRLSQLLGERNEDAIDGFRQLAAEAERRAEQFKAKRRKF